MANNATNTWKWDGRTSTAWRAANWTDGSDTAVDDFPDDAADTAEMTTSTTNAMVACALATTVGTITQGAAYVGAVCVANLTASTVTVVNANGTITGGTITTATVTDGTVSGGTITTLTMLGAGVFTGATVATKLIWNSSFTGGIYGTFPATIDAYQDLIFDDGNTTFAALTTINLMRRGIQVRANLDVHTWAGSFTVNTQQMYGMQGPIQAA